VLTEGEYGLVNRVSKKLSILIGEDGTATHGGDGGKQVPEDHASLSA
jgi:hypothetical protein